MATDNGKLPGPQNPKYLIRDKNGDIMSIFRKPGTRSWYKKQRNRLIRRETKRKPYFLVKYTGWVD